MTRQIITANRLIDGAVVYFTTGNTWSVLIAEAHVFADEKASDDALVCAKVYVEENIVLDPYLIDVTLDGTSVRPMRYREIIRANGPSTYPGTVSMQQGNNTGAVAA